MHEHITRILVDVLLEKIQVCYDGIYLKMATNNYLAITDNYLLKDK